MDDDRSALGKLHCMMDSSSMEANKQKILASKDPGELIYDGLATESLRAQHLASYSRKKALWEADKNVKEACKRFLLSRFELVYFQELSDSITKFKGEVRVKPRAISKYTTGTDRRTVRTKTVLSLTQPFNTKYRVKYPFFAPILALCQAINFTDPII
jgi:hypothetical protein